jgi:hypothetical protein
MGLGSLKGLLMFWTSYEPWKFWDFTTKKIETSTFDIFGSIVGCHSQAKL